MKEDLSMKTRSSILSAICFTVALAIGLHAETPIKQVDASETSRRNPFDSFRSFSATMDGGIGQDHGRQIYRLGNLLRADFGSSYRITDLQKLTMWGVQSNDCAEFAMPDAGAYPFSAYHDFKIERSMTEQKENIDGHVCAIENVTFTDPNAAPVVIKMTLWEAEDLDGFPVKIEAEANGRQMSIAYRNVSLKPPDTKLFRRPAKCGSGPRAGQKDTVTLQAPTSSPQARQKTTAR
jgi:hypothetical protein